MAIILFYKFDFYLKKFLLLKIKGGTFNPPTNAHS